MTVAVGAIGGSGSGISPVYSLSPYLNGVVRTSDAATAAQLQATAAANSAAATAAAIAARGAAAAAATAAPPFDNPAIVSIANRVALQQSLLAQPAVTPNALLSSSDVLPSETTRSAQQLQAQQPQQPSPTDSVLHGDSGEQIQAYGAVALLTGPVALTALYGVPQGPAVPPVAPVIAAPRVAAIETTA